MQQQRRRYNVKEILRRTWNSVDCSKWSQDANGANRRQAEIFGDDAVLERPVHGPHTQSAAVTARCPCHRAIRHRSSFYVIAPLLNRRRQRLDLGATSAATNTLAVGRPPRPPPHTWHYSPANNRLMTRKWNSKPC